MRRGDVRVVQVDDGFLHAAPEQALRLAHEVLVQGVLAGHQHGIAVPLPAGASPALLEARHGAGEAHDERHVQAADIDAELQRLRGDDRVQLVVEQPPLDVAPLLRGVAGAVGQHALRGGAVAVLQAPPHLAVHELGGLAGGREGDDAGAGQHRLGGDVGGLGEGAPPLAAGGVQQRRVPEHDGPLGPGCFVVGHGRERQADEPLGEVPRIGDGRRGEHEAGLAAVGRAQASQAAHDLRHVAAEDAAVHVRLVQHDEAQLVQELRPALVAGQDADVQHVGVAEQDRGGAPQQRALVLRRVAVVDGQARRPGP